MSFFIPETEIDRLIEEDINPFDLTSHILDMCNYNAEITYESRTDVTVCCTEEVERIFKKCDLTVDAYHKSGTKMKKGEIFFSAHGRADNIHLAWRNGLRIFESFCGVSTRTADMVEAAQKINPEVSIVTTRKNMPGTKKLVIKAIVAGGAYPHRLGLSETILIFGPHIHLYGGETKIIEDLERIRASAKEKKIGIEAKTVESALQFVKAGFDFVQLDKFTPEEINKICAEARSSSRDVAIVAAGNINAGNVNDYAASGADVLVTSSLYFGPPADIKATIKKL